MQRHILAGSIQQALFAVVIAGATLFETAHAQDAAAPAAAAPAATQGAADGQTKEKRDGKDVQNLNGVSVTGQLASIRRAQAIKQDATSVVDAVSAEEAGKFPDPNVADALQRVPGVAVDRSGGESSRITVRGFGPDFVNVLLNGRTMATDATDRAFNFDVLPSQLISTAEVRKTATADIAEGGIGGTVNIITARPLDTKGFHAAASVAGVNDNLSSSIKGGFTPRMSALMSNTNADGTFGWLIAGMYDKRDHREQTMNTSGWITGLNYSQINPAYTNIALPQTLSGSDYVQTRTRRGISGAIDWKPLENLTVKFDTMISNYKIDSKYHAFGSYMNTADVQSLTADGNGTALSYVRGNTGVLANDYIEESNPRNAYNEQTGLNLAWQIDNSTVLDWDTAVSRAWNKESANGYFMQVFETILVLLLGAAVVSSFAKRVNIPYPVLLAVGGALLACLPNAPKLDFPPDLVLVLFVAPVLMDAAFDTSLRDLRAMWLPVLSLVLAAVVLTTVAVAFAARWLFPDMPWAAAVALGALLAPPDAVAATTILRKLPVPLRMRMVLEGESLLNDASALLIYKVAVGAVVAGEFHAADAVPMFVLVVFGSVLFGLALTWPITRFMSTSRRRPPRLPTAAR